MWRQGASPLSGEVRAESEQGGPWGGELLLQASFHMLVGTGQSTAQVGLCTLYVFLFIYLAAPVLVVACGIWFPDQGSNPGTLC